MRSSPKTQVYGGREHSQKQQAIRVHLQRAEIITDLERFTVRQGVSLTVGYGPDRLACRMQIEPKRSPSEELDKMKHMRPEVVSDIIDEVLPESQRGREVTISPPTQDAMR